MLGRSALALGVIVGSNLFVWGGLSPTGGEPPSFLGVRGPREVWVLAWLIAALGIFLMRWSRPAGLLVAWASVSAFAASLSGRLYLFVWFDTMFLAALVAWFISCRWLPAKTVLWIIVGLALFQASWFWVQLAGWDPIWRQIRPSEIHWLQRPTVWLDSNANLAHFSSMAAPLAMAVSPWLLIPLAIPILMAMKTLPILGLCLGIVVARRWVLPGMGIFGLAVLFIGLYDPPRFAGDGVRVTVIRDSLKLSLDQPILGRGPGSFKNDFPRWLLTTDHGLGEIAVRNPETNIHNLQAKLPTHTEVFYHPSNELVKGIFELGWPILVIVLWGVVLWVKKAVAMPKDRWRDAFAGASVAFAVTVLGYQPFVVPPLAVAGLAVWGVFDGMLKEGT